MPKDEMKAEAKPFKNSQTEGLNSGPLLSRKDVARLLGCHVETVKRMQRRGQLPAIILNSRFIRYSRSDVEKLLRSGKV